MKLKYFLLSLAAYLFFIVGCLVMAGEKSKGSIAMTSAAEIELPSETSHMMIFENDELEPILEITEKGEIILRGKTLAIDAGLGKMLSTIYGWNRKDQPAKVKFP